MANVSIDAPAPCTAPPPDTPYPLAAIHDAALEELVADTYQRDYLMFGFSPWQA